MQRHAIGPGPLASYGQAPGYRVPATPPTSLTYNAVTANTGTAVTVNTGQALEARNG